MSSYCNNSNSDRSSADDSCSYISDLTLQTSLQSPSSITMTFPPCFAPTSPRRTALDRMCSVYGESRTNNAVFHPHNELYHEQQQLASPPLLSYLVSPNMVSSSVTTTVAPRSATPDQYNNATEDEQDSSHCMEEESKQLSELSDDDHAARILLGLSRIVSKEMLSDSNCMNKNEKKRSVEEEFKPINQSNANDPSPQANGNVSHSRPSLGIPESITIEYPSGNTRLIRVTSNESMGTTGVPPVTVLSSPSVSLPSPPSSPPSSGFYSRASTIELLRARASSSMEQQRIRSVSLAAEDMMPAVVSSMGGAHTNRKALSPLLLPLCPSRDLSALGIHEHVSPRSRHLPRFHHPLCRQELELLEQQKEEERKKALRMAAVAAVITPIPRQPRPVLQIGTLGMGNQSAGNSIKDTEDVSSHETDRKRHAPLELPPLLLNINQNSKPKQEKAFAAPGIATRVCNKGNQRVASGTSSRIAARNSKILTASTRSKKKTSPSVAAAAAKKATKPHQTGKKFSWKAYPELEDFLITNREEYLSFSARNYTIEQRDYNNRLTARLLEHATVSGYPDLFQHCAFSAVRDRIRSYYKSYVQSFKRRKERQQQLRQKALVGNVASKK
mmetsp:Transcript_31876/g.75002  ORF Transcript_31876/g.75002 Transcript_31876/m.75002 type:complete len:615 (+) Transcript_31876:194-2038(+)